MAEVVLCELSLDVNPGVAGGNPRSAAQVGLQCSAQCSAQCSGTELPKDTKPATIWINGCKTEEELVHF